MTQQGMDSSDENSEGPRRDFLTSLTTLAMGSGLLAGYGTFAAHAVRFLFPADRQTTAWQFVSTLAQLKKGEALPFQTPAGAKVVIARQAEGDTADSFIALSSVCPHLGCAVHWEAQNDRFFCPCHNGAFDPSGQPIAGPPAAANQPLTRFPLKVEDGLLFIEIRRESLTVAQEA